ncbi:MAG: sulfatase [Planctomycetes bacterium]|nr:sulfatase [Planctomycetota bacterium]
MKRREFIRYATGFSVGSLFGLVGCSAAQQGVSKRSRPNVVFLLADQWRSQAAGFAGNADVITPNLDRLAAASINLTNAVSGCPVCSPYRGSLMTGQYPLTHGVFVNDVQLGNKAVSIAQAYKAVGYDTAYIGKWHLDGRGRSNFTPPERLQGFEFWRALECTHNYNNSVYYADSDVKLKWDGYDAIAQTREAQRYIRTHSAGKPFVLFVSWGPPHAPYLTAPSKYKALFEGKDIKLRPNVPENMRAQAKKDIAGYYAHIAALDDCVGRVTQTLKECGLQDNTILVFTSDHGDMLYSQGGRKKQQPWDESIKVPFLVRYPAVLGSAGGRLDMPFNTPDIMPTLLGLSGVEVPDTVEGEDYSGVLTGKEKADNDAALIMCPQPFGQWTRRIGGREYRGVRTRRYTYTRDLNGPWLLYDNLNDPHQLNNLCNKPEYARVQKQMEVILARKLKETNDQFLSGPEYIKKWGYTVGKNGTVPYTN